MQVDKNNIDDLNYIANLGFENTPVTDKDLADLKTKIKRKYFPYNNGRYFSFISLIVGVLIGVFVFFIFDKKPFQNIQGPSRKILNDTVIADNKIKLKEKVVLLDTIMIFKENFILPRVSQNKIADTSIFKQRNILDIPMTMESKPISSSIILNKTINESKLKYILNSPIVYIHELKVTNYTTLYFNKNQYIKFSANMGLPVTFANKEDNNQTNMHLKQSADYYLHEELANALQLFKNANYDQCIFSLNTISNYTHEDLNCNFYLAMCYYYKKNYKKAINFFESCTQNANNSFFQEANYYLALSLHDSGDETSAHEKFKFIADEGEFYAEKAKQFLTK